MKCQSLFSGQKIAYILSICRLLNLPSRGSLTFPCKIKINQWVWVSFPVNGMVS